MYSRHLRVALRGTDMPTLGTPIRISTSRTPGQLEEDHLLILLLLIQQEVAGVVCLRKQDSLSISRVGKVLVEEKRQGVGG